MQQRKNVKDKVSLSWFILLLLGESFNSAIFIQFSYALGLDGASDLVKCLGIFSYLVSTIFVCYVIDRGASGAYGENAGAIVVNSELEGK